MVSSLSQNDSSNYLVQVVVGDGDLSTWLESCGRSTSLRIVGEALESDDEAIRIKKLSLS